MLSAPQGALSMKSAKTKIILDGEKFINIIKSNKLQASSPKLQAP